MRKKKAPVTLASVSERVDIAITTIAVHLSDFETRLKRLEERCASQRPCETPPEKRSWLGRLHRRKWFCLPWCRYWQ